MNSVLSENEEHWKYIEGLEGYYMVSSCGLVKSIDHYITDKRGGNKFFSGKILSQTTSKNGYLMVTISVNSRRRIYIVSRLVATAFLPNPENKREVNHIDGNKANNHVSNLEWNTSSENKKHAYKNGLKKSLKGIYIGGKSKISKKVTQMSLDGSIIRTFDSVIDVERELGFCSSCICMCCNGRRKRSYGFLWSYNIN